MSAVEISASAVMKLREETGAGMMECKKALTEAGGDAAKAVEILRERGLKKSAEKQSRVANEGTVLSSVNDARNFAVMVEINCETDFVAKNDDFVKFSNNVLAQVRD
ncbi:translation elongation factor Ts, partial [bacterium]|nr:translation elongation factor Ts [bacterium]